MIRLPNFLVAKFCPNGISDNPNFTRTKNFHFNVKKGSWNIFFISLQQINPAQGLFLEELFIISMQILSSSLYAVHF